jgi:hypothetical protein
MLFTLKRRKIILSLANLHRSHLLIIVECCSYLILYFISLFLSFRIAIVNIAMLKFGLPFFLRSHNHCIVHSVLHTIINICFVHWSNHACWSKLLYFFLDHRSLGYHVEYVCSQYYVSYSTISICPEVGLDVEYVCSHY